MSESRPLQVGVVIFDDVEVLDFAGPFEVFTVAGRLGGPQEGEIAIKAVTIAQSERLVHARGNLLIQPHFTFENHPPLDVIVVPGGWGTRREVDNPVMMDWL
jgi:transcriptional regulator GlxA family with amidase domain